MVASGCPGLADEAGDELAVVVGQDVHDCYESDAVEAAQEANAPNNYGRKSKVCGLTPKAFLNDRLKCDRFEKP